MANVRAQLNNLRMSPRKTRAVVDLLRGKSVDEAINQLNSTVRDSAAPIKKLIESAIAGAENNLQMVRDNLYIKSFYVDEGRKMKRYMPRARGMAGAIHKKTSHLKLVLDEKVAGIRSEKKKEEPKHDHTAQSAESVETVAEEKIETKKAKIEKEIKTKKPNRIMSLGKKIFQRKAI